MHVRAFRHLVDALMRRSRKRRSLRPAYKTLVNLNEQTRVLKDGSRICNYLPTDELVPRHYADVATLFEAVRRGSRLSENGFMLGARNKNVEGEPYEWIHYDEVINRSIDLAHAFQALGIATGQQTCIGLYSQNRPEWVIVEHAAYTFNNVLVPFYETLGSDACIFIINQTEVRLVVCDSLDKARSLIEQRSKCPDLQFLVVMEETIEAEDMTLAKGQGIKLMTLNELERLGREQPRRNPQPPKSNDLATICYTSGTTGTPKGVMLTHGNVIADATAMDYFKNVELSKDDVMLSYLPLAHMFERVMQLVVYTEGGRVGFFSGNISTLVDDIKTLQPTVLPVVPRVLNRIYDKVLNKVSKSSAKKAIFDVVMKYNLHELHSGVLHNPSWIDQLIFKEIRDGMGGRLKLMITGSAPLGEDVMNFFRATMGCVILEGYGQTEAVGCVTISLEGDAEPGHVGVPIPCNAVKLIDVPELGYFAKDNAGEVCVRGANVFRGYYKNEDGTRSVLDDDGWLHTGDIGRWTERGTLKIFDRKKDIFKLAQGEYVAPERIENVYACSKFVAQSFVHGESLKDQLIAIIVPDPEVLLVEAAKYDLFTFTIEELCQRDDIKATIFRDILNVGDEAKLMGFEQVKDIYLSPEPFTIENGLLTPTLKSKRAQLVEKFRSQIDGMYKNMEEQ